MKRPNIEEIEKRLEDLLKQATREHSHFYTGSVVKEALEVVKYAKWHEEQDKRRDWPTLVHQQYLHVLDERDTLQEEIDGFKLVMKMWFGVSEEALDKVIQQHREERNAENH